MSKADQIREMFTKHLNETGEMLSVAHLSKAVGYDIRHAFRVVAKLKRTLGLLIDPITIKKEPDSNTKVSIHLGIESGEIEVNSLVNHTVDQILELADIDLSKWEITSTQVNSWQVTMKVKRMVGTVTTEEPEQRTNYQVKVKLRPKIIGPLEVAMQKLIERFPIREPFDFLIPDADGDFMFELALYDAHFGKLAWAKETGQQDYDIKIAERVFSEAARKLLGYAKQFKIGKILFPVGQDFFHAENFNATTPNGHNILDVDGRLPKIIDAGIASIIDAIGLCLSIAPVEVIWVPGNHDMHASYWMTKLLKHHFKDIPQVTVDISKEWRKSCRWGDCLVAFSHGDSEKRNMLPAIMAQFWKKDFSECRFHEWHVGHFHKKNEEKFQPTQTVGGVIVRQIPTLSAIDAWHYQHGFVDAIRAGEAFLWDKKGGVVAHYTANVEV